MFPIIIQNAVKCRRYQKSKQPQEVFELHSYLNVGCKSQDQITYTTPGLLCMVATFEIMSSLLVVDAKRALVGCYS